MNTTAIIIIRLQFVDNLLIYFIDLFLHLNFSLHPVRKNPYIPQIYENPMWVIRDLF